MKSIFYIWHCFTYSWTCAVYWARGSTGVIWRSDMWQRPIQQSGGQVKHTHNLLFYQSIFEQMFHLATGIQTHQPTRLSQTSLKQLLFYLHFRYPINHRHLAIQDSYANGSHHYGQWWKSLRRWYYTVSFYGMFSLLDNIAWDQEVYSTSVWSSQHSSVIMNIATTTFKPRAGYDTQGVIQEV